MPTMVQVRACRLVGAKPLQKPFLAYCQLDSWEQISVKFESEFNHFRSRKWFENVVCQYGSHFSLSRGRWVKSDLDHSTHRQINFVGNMRDTVLFPLMAYHRQLLRTVTKFGPVISTRCKYYVSWRVVAVKLEHFTRRITLVVYQCIYL